LPEDTWQISWPVRCGNQRISALSQEYLHNTSTIYGPALLVSIILKKLKVFCRRRGFFIFFQSWSIIYYANSGKYK
jgi:hypothetical protein